MIYFDNAATTMLKPPQVAQAVARAIDSFGGVGRGVHESSLAAGLAVFEARQAVSDLLGGPGPRQVAFCLNATEALNIIIDGLVGPGCHAITTAASHNSVLRPLYRAHDSRGAQVDVLPVAPDGSIDYDAFDALFCPQTRLAVVTHASNLTGDVYDVQLMARIAHSHGALLAIDAAQTAGAIPIDMAAQGIDIVAFTGHKSLFGPQGTGGLCVSSEVVIPAFKVGGSGTHSFDRAHPDFMPEHLEAGTLNAHGIAGLAAGISYIRDTGVESIHEQTMVLADRFEQGVAAIEGVHVLGGHGGCQRCGIVAINVGSFDSAQVSDALNVDYGICTRAGAHCAPLMHEALGTQEQGAVRFSFSHFNTADEVDAAVAAVAEIAGGL